MTKHPISVVIPVYKNYEMFYRYLEINRKYLKDCEVIIMNDFPDTDISGPVKKIFPEAVVFNQEKNLGFAGNVNSGIKKSGGKYVFLMNSDVVLKDDSFTRAVSYFESDPDLFAVGFTQTEADGKKVGSNNGYFSGGLINHSFRKAGQVTEGLSDNFWAEGGSSIFRKDLLFKLGLLDELFNPFYWEDIDLSYRAWKSGYKVKFTAKVTVEHHHESTIGKYFQQKKIQRTAFRNQLIFNWKNLTDGNLIFNHLLNLPRLMLLPGFTDALIRLPAILGSRKKTVKLFKRTDREVLSYFNNTK